MPKCKIKIILIYVSEVILHIESYLWKLNEQVKINKYQCFKSKLFE